MAAAKYVDQPVVFEIDGGNVRVTVRSNGKKYRFIVPMHYFITALASGHSLVRDWTNGQRAAIPLRIEAAH